MHVAELRIFGGVQNHNSITQTTTYILLLIANRSSTLHFSTLHSNSLPIPSPPSTSTNNDPVDGKADDRRNVGLHRKTEVDRGVLIHPSADETRGYPV